MAEITEKGYEQMDGNNRYYQKELEENCRKQLDYMSFCESHILVTGANGLIGSYLVDTLLKMNDLLGVNLQVTALCRSSHKGQKRFADYLDRSDFELLVGDVGKRETYQKSKYYGQWDYMVQGAGNAHPQAFAAQPVETMKANLLGTIHLLDEAVRQELKHPVKKMILLSSGEVYGECVSNAESGWKESEAGVVDSMRLRACYPEGKRAAETLCASYAAEYGVKAVVARLAYIYGPTMQENNTRADVQFLSRAAAGETIIMKSAGEQYRSYCYVQDAVIGILTLLLNGTAGEAYNIANGDSNVTIRTFAETVAEAFQVPLQFEKPTALEQAGYSTMKREILDAGKLETLGWKAQIDIRTGIDRIRDMLTT